MRELRIGAPRFVELRLVLDAVRRSRESTKALLAYGTAAHLTLAICALIELPQGGLHLLQRSLEREDERHVLFALEQLAALVRRVLVDCVVLIILKDIGARSLVEI